MTENNIYEELIGGNDNSTNKTHVVTSPTSSSNGGDVVDIGVSLAQYLAAHPEVSVVQALIDVLQFTNASLPNTPGVVNLKRDSDSFEIEEVIRLLESLHSEDEDEKPLIIPAYVATAQSLGRDAINIDQLLTESPLGLEQRLKTHAHEVAGRTNSESSNFQRTYYQLCVLYNSLGTKKVEQRKGTYDFKLLRKQSIEGGNNSDLDKVETALRHARIKVIARFVVGENNDAHDEVAIDGIKTALGNIFINIRTLLESMNRNIEKNSNDDRFELYANLSQKKVNKKSITNVNIMALNHFLQKCELGISVSIKTDRQTAREDYQQAWTLVTTKIQQLRENLQYKVIQKGEHLCNN